MLQFKSIKKTLLTTVSVATITVGSLSASEPIGSITEHKGEAYLTRDLQQEPIAVGAVIPDVLLNDTAETKDGRMLIKFLDNGFKYSLIIWPSFIIHQFLTFLLLCPEYH